MSVTIRMIGCAVTLAATASLGPAQAQQSQPPPIAIAPTTTDLTPEVATAVQAWRNQVSGLLMRSKRFPPEARKLQQEGSVRLRFSLDRTGAVTSRQIVLSSGYELLDKEALQILQRAQPFPPPPEQTGEQIFLVVPITFSLAGQSGPTRPSASQGGRGVPPQAQQSQAGMWSEDGVWLGGEVALSDLSGARINSHWFRYVNERFGLAIDIPTKGYRYTTPANGSGLTLTSLDGEIVITIYNHYGPNLVDDAKDDVQTSIAKLFDSAVSDTLKANGTIEYSVRKDDFYVISGRHGSNTYYERLTISRECLDTINAVRIFHPKRLERRLHQLTTRLSTSLTATCNGAG